MNFMVEVEHATGLCDGSAWIAHLQAEAAQFLVSRNECLPHPF
jgi:hypothetical protein